MDNIFGGMLKNWDSSRIAFENLLWAHHNVIFGILRGGLRN
jgi:hypothetical protein